MSDHIIIDIESKHLVKDRPLHLIGMSCAVVYECEEDNYLIYGDREDELEKLKLRLMKASRITSWGGWKFDLPVIWGLQAPHKVIQLYKTNDDLRQRVYESQGLDPEDYQPNLHGEWSLDTVVQSTLRCKGKTGKGSDAPQLYKSNQWGKLLDYCMHDVKLTRDLVRFVDKYGYLHGKNGMIANIGKWKEND